MMDFKALLSFSATVSTIGLFLTGIQICAKIRTQGNTQNISIVPFLAAVVNTVLWTKYGVLIKDQTVILTNGAGIVFEIMYVLIYYLNTKDRRDVHTKLVYTSLIIYPALMAIKFVDMPEETALYYTGLLASFGTIIMYAAPLSVVAQVIKTRSTEALSFPLSFVGFLVSVQWFLYGRLIHDSFMQIPNFIGMILGAIQLFLFVRYPSSSRKYDLSGPSSVI